MAVIKVPINDLDIVVGLDPAISEKLKAARTALIVMAMTPSSRMVVLDYWVGRQGDPLLVIERMLDMCKTWKPRCIGIETIAYQKALKPFSEREMAKRDMHIPIIELRPDHNGRIVEKKNQRILSMQPFFKTGQIYIQRGMMDLIEEYETFPLGATKDLLDIMAYCFRLLTPNKDSKKSSNEIVIERLKQGDPAAYAYWRAYMVSKGLLDPEPDMMDEDDQFSYETAKQGIGELL